MCFVNFTNQQKRGRDIYRALNSADFGLFGRIHNFSEGCVRGKSGVRSFSQRKKRLLLAGALDVRGRLTLRGHRMAASVSRLRLFRARR